MSTVPSSSDGDFRLMPMSVEVKIVLVGSQSVGKTSIAKRFVHRTFDPRSHSTVGASLLTKRIMVDGCAVKLQLWDSAGQERFRSLAPLFFRGTHAAIVVYDITSRKSFEDLDSWISDLNKYAGDDCQVIFVVGNKSDLTAERAVSIREGREYAQALGATFFDYEISALNDDGIDELFYELARQLLLEHRSRKGAYLADEWESIEQTRKGRKTVNLHDPVSSPGSGCYCSIL